MYKINYIISYLRNNFRKIYLIQFDCFFFFNSLTICQYQYHQPIIIIVIIINTFTLYLNLFCSSSPIPISHSSHIHHEQNSFLPLSHFLIFHFSPSSRHLHAPLILPNSHVFFRHSCRPRQQLPLSHFHNRTTIIRKTKAVIWLS
jgi:hypothetical protein